MKESSEDLPFVSVIIPVYNDSHRLKLCLMALQSQTYPKGCYEIIVVDNNSEEDIAGVVDGFKQVKLFFAKQPGSYSARNAGLKVATGEILAFTDSDCLPASDWLEKGVHIASETPNCGLVGGQMDIFPKDPNKPTPVELYDQVLAFPQKHFIEVGHFSVTANLFTFREVFDDVGFFCEDMFSGGDTEWSRRVYNKGYQLIYADDVVVAHPARRSLENLLKKSKRYAGGSYLLLRDKPGHFIKAIMKDFMPRKYQFQIILRDGRLHGFGQRMVVLIILMIFKYIRNFERMRLILGGEPRRA